MCYGRKRGRLRYFGRSSGEMGDMMMSIPLIMKLEVRLTEKLTESKWEI